MSYSVLVLDMFDYMNDEANSVVDGFETQELATEYARRRTRAAVEEQRGKQTDHAVIKSMWMMFGEDCITSGYIGGHEVDYFIDNPAPVDSHPELTDWMALDPKRKQIWNLD